MFHWVFVKIERVEVRIEMIGITYAFHRRQGSMFRIVVGGPAHRMQMGGAQLYKRM